MNAIQVIATIILVLPIFIIAICQIINYVLKKPIPLKWPIIITSTILCTIIAIGLYVWGVTMS